jgi:hypothetical protein
MKRVLGQALSVVVVGVLATAFTPACAENDQSIFIRSALAPSTNRQGGSCLYTNDPTQASLFSGIVDIAVRDSYGSVLLVGNQMVPRGDATNTRAESNRAHINGAVVRVTDPNGGQLGEFTSLATGFIDPQINNQPSFGSVGVTAIDAPTLARIGEGMGVGVSKLVVANIKVFGKSVGGVDLESGEFQFPIRVCSGCLITPTGDDPAQQGCQRASDATGTDQLPCQAGQDEPTPCWLCSDRPACQAAVP